MSRIGDQKVVKISYLIGYLEAAEAFSPVEWRFVENLIYGNHSEHGEGAPDINALYVASNVGLPTNCGKLDPAVAKSIIDISVSPAVLDAAKQALLRNKLLFANFDIGEFSGALHEIAGDSPLHDNMYRERRRFLATDNHDPSIVAHLPAALRAHYRSTLIDQVGVSQRIVEFFSFDPSLPPTASVTQGAHTWWQLTSAGKNRDYLGIVRVADDAKESGQPLTKLAVTGKIVSLLQSAKVNEAVEAAASYYRMNHDLINWLPFRELASSLDDRTVGRYSGSTDMALVVWLLAENHNRDFKSPLSYAVERFLEGRGVERPSELDIKNEDQIELFLREICSEETLSLSLIYENQEELDGKRIKILKLLSEVFPESSKLYDDEVTLILRRQEVTKAIKSLDRSKISIDEEPIKD